LNTGLNNPNFKKIWTLGARILQLVPTGMNPTTYQLHWVFEGNMFGDVFDYNVNIL